MNFINTLSDKKIILDRFLSYVKICTTSNSENADKGIQPSTTQQFDLANILVAELKTLGAIDVQITEHCYVYAKIPATKGFENIPPFALLAHLDTSEEVSGKNIKPILTETNGDTIITSDGTTLLGADDKAGITAIMSTLEYLYNHKEISHGVIEICFSPDEETGHGMDNVPLHLITSKRAYTVDGGDLGELETECFNAYKTEVHFEGVSCHTGTAKGKMISAIRMASHFITNLPTNELPETTEGYQGFYAPLNMTCSIENAKIIMILRDFTTDGIKNKKSIIEKLAKETAELFNGKFNVYHELQYLNMKDELSKYPEIVNDLIKAYELSQIKPKFIPIRGGTDGSRLTEIGIPTPNIFTGGHDFHSKTEWCSLNQLSKAVDVLINLALVISKS